MSSVEKKQIVQNTIFGTVAGLVMGGPIGAIAVGVTGAALAHLEEQRDEELREKERKRRQTDPVALMEKQKARERESKERTDKFREITKMIVSKQPTVLDGRYKIEYDPYRNNSYCVPHIKPNVRPYGIVSIYERRLWFAYHDDPMIVANATFYDINGFYDKLCADIDNPEIYMYSFITNNSFNNGGSIRGRVYYMYTIDGAKTFNVLMN